MHALILPLFLKIVDSVAAALGREICEQINNKCELTEQNHSHTKSLAYAAEKQSDELIKSDKA